MHLAVSLDIAAPSGQAVLDFGQISAFVRKAEAMGVDRTTAQPRTSELRLRHMIKDSGQRRRNASGKRAIVWVALSDAERAEVVLQNAKQPNAGLKHEGANDA